MQEEKTPAPAQEENKQIGFTDDQKKEMCAFVNVSAYDGLTLFIDLQYKGVRKGRTCIVMGGSGLHARIIGRETGMVHNEALGMNMEQDQNFDINLKVKRSEIISVNKVRREIDWEQNKDHIQKNIDERPKYNYDVVITYMGGIINIVGLTEDHANYFQAVIWNWSNFIEMQQAS